MKSVILSLVILLAAAGILVSGAFAHNKGSQVVAQSTVVIMD